MYQKQQPLIISSKRNTTYLMPLMNANNTENENNNNLTNANPFPVNHINSNASAIIKDKDSYTGNFLFFLFESPK
jgi:hypothetical protein